MSANEDGFTDAWYHQGIVVLAEKIKQTPKDSMKKAKRCVVPFISVGEHPDTDQFTLMREAFRAHWSTVDSVDVSVNTRMQ